MLFKFVESTTLHHQSVDIRDVEIFSVVGFYLKSPRRRQLKKKDVFEVWNGREGSENTIKLNFLMPQVIPEWRSARINDMFLFKAKYWFFSRGLSVA